MGLMNGGSSLWQGGAMKGMPATALKVVCSTCFISQAFKMYWPYNSAYRPASRSPGAVASSSGTVQSLSSPKHLPPSIEAPDMAERGQGESPFTGEDRKLMRRALKLAAKGLGRTRPNPVVGCVILDIHGNVVGEGFHPKAGEPHAEVFALKEAAERARGGTAYVTLEPCNHHGRTPPCVDALLQAGISKVIAGMVDPFPLVSGKGLDRLRAHGVQVWVGCEEQRCQELNRPFVYRTLHGRPFGFMPLRWTEGMYRRVGRGLARLPEAQGVLELVDAIIVDGSRGVKALDWLEREGKVADQVLRVVLGDVRDAYSLGTRGSEGFVLQDRTLREVGHKGGEVRGESLQRTGWKVVELEDLRPQTIAGQMYRMGLLSVLWLVGPEFGEEAIREGCVQEIWISSNLSEADGLQEEGSLERRWGVEMRVEVMTCDAMAGECVLSLRVGKGINER